MLFASASDATIKAQDLERIRAEEAQRVRRFARRHLLLCGDSKAAVVAEVRSMFRNAENAAKVSILADTSAQPFRYICEEIARFPGAKRAFVDAAGEPDQVYARIERDVVSFDLWMQEATLALFALNDAVLHVLPGRTPDDAPTIRLFRPHEITVVPYHDAPDQPFAVMYPSLLPNGETVDVVWTPTEHYVRTRKRGEVRLAEGMESTANPYGLLPFVGLHAGLRADRFWDTETGEDLVNADVQYKAGWSALKHARHYSGFPQPVISGIREGDKFEPPQTLDPASLWQLPDGATATTLSLNADLGGNAGTLKMELGQTVAMYGLLVEDVLGNAGQAPPSGLARAVKRQPLTERRDRLKPFLVEAEHALAEMYRWAWNWNHAEKISESAQFTVELRTDASLLSPVEQEEVRKARLGRYRAEIELGTKTLVQVLAEERGVTEAAAREEIASRETGNGGSLNGAQITALQGVVEAAAAGRISPESAVALITAGFPITEEVARRIVGAGPTGAPVAGATNG